MSFKIKVVLHHLRVPSPTFLHKTFFYRTGFQGLFVLLKSAYSFLESIFFQIVSFAMLLYIQIMVDIQMERRIFSGGSVRLRTRTSASTETLAEMLFLRRT